MAYATQDELAVALRIRVTPSVEELLQQCLDAAATEIDHEIDAPLEAAPLDFDPQQAALANRVNVVRGVEWFKAQDAAFGAIGYEQIGVLQMPRDGFARHAVELTPLKRQWGIA